MNDVGEMLEELKKMAAEKMHRFLSGKMMLMKCSWQSLRWCK